MSGTLTVTEGGKSSETECKLEWGSQLANGDRAFVKALRTGKKSGILSSYADGLKTLAVTLAADRSMATGKPQKVAKV